MGCMKSKQTFPFPTTIESDDRHGSAESFMSEERFRPRMPSVINEEVKEPSKPEIVVFEFAHRLSQQILSDALQQWANNNIKYYDIPFIESEGPWHCRMMTLSWTVDIAGASLNTGKKSKKWCDQMT